LKTNATGIFRASAPQTDFLKGRLDVTSDRSQTVTPANGRLRDLVVEDEFVIADTLAAILKSIGFDAAPIYSGNVAVANARDSGLGSLVCDTILDGVSGIETAIQIRAIGPNCRIV
jgi:ActR/RegA family two-component response regulator